MFKNNLSYLFLLCFTHILCSVFNYAIANLMTRIYEINQDLKEELGTLQLPEFEVSPILMQSLGNGPCMTPMSSLSSAELRA